MLFVADDTAVMFW